ncbi:MAG: hypothetical protein ACAI43_18410 [Phycisphaerae bacterium]|nr:hypothetical protein [Tepidisphaeraceae bacterium]
MIRPVHWLAIVLLVFASVRAAAAPTAVDLLRVKEFWDLPVAADASGLNRTIVPDLRRVLAESPDRGTRLRATMLLCDLDGNRRVAPGLDPAVARKAFAAAMRHIEANLDDAAVARFGPEDGVSHATVTRRTDGAMAGVWVLIETVTPENRGGLNVRVDPDTGKVDRVDVWGRGRGPVIIEIVAAAPAVAPPGKPMGLKLLVRNVSAAAVRLGDARSPARWGLTATDDAGRTWDAVVGDPPAGPAAKPADDAAVVIAPAGSESIVRTIVSWAPRGEREKGDPPADGLPAGRYVLRATLHPPVNFEEAGAILTPVHARPVGMTVAEKPVGPRVP